MQSAALQFAKKNTHIAVAPINDPQLKEEILQNLETIKMLGESEKLIELIRRDLHLPQPENPSIKFEFADKNTHIATAPINDRQLKEEILQNLATIKTLRKTEHLMLRIRRDLLFPQPENT